MVNNNLNKNKHESKIWKSKLKNKPQIRQKWDREPDLVGSARTENRVGLGRFWGRADKSEWERERGLCVERWERERERNSTDL